MKKKVDFVISVSQILSVIFLFGYFPVSIVVFASTLVIIEVVTIEVLVIIELITILNSITI